MPTEPTGSPEPTRPEGPSEAGRARSPRWWIAAATFLGGILVGVLVVGLLRAGTPDFVQASQDAAQNAPTPAAPGGFPVGAQAEVNAACLRVINGAQDVTRILSGVDDAASDVDLQRMDDIVRQLQPLEQRLQRDLAECRVNAVSVNEPPPSQTPSGPPSGSPPTPGEPTPTPGDTASEAVPTAEPS